MNVYVILWHSIYGYILTIFEMYLARHRRCNCQLSWYHLRIWNSHIIICLIQSCSRLLRWDFAHTSLSGGNGRQDIAFFVYFCDHLPHVSPSIIQNCTVFAGISGQSARQVRKIICPVSAKTSPGTTLPVLTVLSSRRVTMNVKVCECTYTYI